jgi:hypothetical protein
MIFKTIPEPMFCSSHRNIRACWYSARGGWM